MVRSNQIFKSSNASCCSFLLYSHAGFYRFVAQICNCFCKTVEPCWFALRFSASPVMLTHIASRCQIPSCPPKLQRRRMGVPNISPLERNLKRVFLCLDSGKEPFFRGMENFEKDSAEKSSSTTEYHLKDFRYIQTVPFAAEDTQIFA